MRLGWWVVALAFAGMLLSACTGATPTAFLPPIPVPQALSPTPPEQVVAPTPAATLTPAPSATPACSNNLTFLEDLSVPDGTLVQAGEVLDKGWLVENSGTCNWNESYRVVLVSGPGMQALPEQALYPARSGTQAILHIQFTAPAEPGLHQSAWQAVDPQGSPFGDAFFIQVLVGGALPTP